MATGSNVFCAGVCWIDADQKPALPCQYVILQSKKVLYDSDLVSMDGHTFLSMLNHNDSIRKMELIKANYSEVSSGIEVIKRLLRKGFIEEFNDPNDKRSKRVRITNVGKMEHEKTLPDLRKVLDIMAGNLSDEKKIKCFAR